MNKDQVKEILVSLTENQAKLFKVVLERGTAASGASGLSGPSLGRAASSLHEKDLIVPMGRKGRQFKWSPSPIWEENWKNYRKEITNLLKKITEDY